LCHRDQLYSEDYNPGMDPRVTNEFAAAGFRVGHTMVTKTVE
jgi:hypothetical protein